MQDSQRQGRQHRVPVRVDEARHQNPAAAIDDADVGDERALGRLDRLDRLAVDHDPQTRQERVRLAVEQPYVGERDGASSAAPKRGAGVLPDPAANTPSEAPVGGDGRIAGEFLREMRVQSCKRRRVAKTPCPPRRFPITRAHTNIRVPPKDLIRSRRFRGIEQTLCRIGAPLAIGEGASGCA